MSSVEPRVPLPAWAMDESRGVEPAGSLVAECGSAVCLCVSNCPESEASDGAGTTGSESASRTLDFFFRVLDVEFVEEVVSEVGSALVLVAVLTFVEPSSRVAAATTANAAAVAAASATVAAVVRRGECCGEGCVDPARDEAADGARDDEAEVEAEAEQVGAAGTMRV
jgi:hypothetical protein